MNQIKNTFQRVKIGVVQIDLNGHCNAGCWFCPISYVGNPIETKKQMDPDLLEKILEDIYNEKVKEEGVVSKDIDFFFTSHYNEVLMYSHLEHFFKLLRKYKFRAAILSNGTPLTPKKIDLLNQYQDVIYSILLNIPVFSNDELWAKRTKLNKSLFPKLIRNIKYLEENVKNIPISIQINGFDKGNLFENGGNTTIEQNFPKDFNLNDWEGETYTELKYAQNMFPSLEVFSVTGLMDRGGLLSNVFTNYDFIEKNKNITKKQNPQVIGCGWDHFKNGSGLPFNTLCINPLGETFLCCNDFYMEYKFGDFKNNSLKEFWGSQNHIENIEKAYKGICTTCVYGVFE